MNEYKRLTKQKRKSEAIADIVKSEYRNSPYVANRLAKRLAELEDKIENGTLVELPCKVGDVVWYVIHRGEYSTLCSTTVKQIKICSRKEMIIELNGTVRKIYIGLPNDDNAFLTKEQAEARLKELRGDKQ